MPARRVHVAIVNPRAAGALLAGAKRIESRLSRQRRPPYDAVAPGDRIYFKLSGGALIGVSSVARVLQFDELTPTRIDRLRRLYNHAVCAPREYWRSRRECRYGVLIWLTGLWPQVAGPGVPRQYGRGWLTVAPGWRRRVRST